MPPVKVPVTLNNLSRPCHVSDCPRPDAAKCIRAACGSDLSAWLLHGTHGPWQWLGSPAAAPDVLQDQLTFVELPASREPVSQPTVLALSKAGQLWTRRFTVGSDDDGQWQRVQDVENHLIEVSAAYRPETHLLAAYGIRKDKSLCCCAETETGVWSGWRQIPDVTGVRRVVVIADSGLKSPEIFVIAEDRLLHATLPSNPVELPHFTDISYGQKLNDFAVAAEPFALQGLTTAGQIVNTSRCIICKRDSGLCIPSWAGTWKEMPGVWDGLLAVDNTSSFVTGESGALFWSKMSAANGPSPHEPLNVRVLTMSLDPSPALAALAIDNDGHLVGALRDAPSDAWSTWQQLPCPERTLETVDDIKLLVKAGIAAGQNFARESIQTAWLRDTIYMGNLDKLDAACTEILSSGTATQEQLAGVAEYASQLRNGYLQLTRQKMGRASVTFSEIIKEKGISYEKILDLTSKKLGYGEGKFSSITDETQRMEVMTEVIRKSGRANSKVLFATRALGSVSLFLSIITAGVAIAEIMTAENKIAEALNQAAHFAGVIGGAEAGAALGAAVGAAGGPVTCLIGWAVGGFIGSFIGGSIADHASDVLIHYLWPGWEEHRQRLHKRGIFPPPEDATRWFSKEDDFFGHPALPDSGVA